MGITGNCAKFLLYSKKLGVDFSHTIMLGRQQLFINQIEWEELHKKFYDQPQLPDSGGFAEPFFKLLGGETIESLDYSDFEGATLIYDLNSPISQTQQNKYSVVFDGGTLEHVFNFPIAIKNCMDMLAIGGHFVSLTPTNNYCGHGFYQFSPELFFTLFTQQNGFKIKLVAMGVELPSKGITEWFEVKDPQHVKRRVTLCNSHPTSLMIIAEKITETIGTDLRLFQSDYQHIWTVHDSIHNEVQMKGEKRWMHIYRKRTPGFIKKILRRITGVSEKNIYEEGLGIVNPLFFSKMDV